MVADEAGSVSDCCEGDALDHVAQVVEVRPGDCRPKASSLACAGGYGENRSGDDVPDEFGRARIHVSLGVYQPSNPFVDNDCSYDIPGKKNLWLNLAERWPVYDGQPLRDEDFPRWDSTWSSVPWRARSYTLSHSEPGRAPIELFHDCASGARSGTGLM